MKALKWLDKNFEEAILVFFLALMTIVMTAQIIARIIGTPFTWSEELSRFLFVWSGFLSISFCFKKQISIKIDQLVDFFPEKGKAVVKIFEKIVMLAFYFYMLQYCLDYFNRALQSNQLSPAMQIPMYLVHVAPLVGFTLAIFRLLQSFFDKSLFLVTGKPEKPKDEPELDTLL